MINMHQSRKLNRNIVRSLANVGKPIWVGHSSGDKTKTNEVALL